MTVVQQKDTAQRQRVDTGTKTGEKTAFHTSPQRVQGRKVTWFITDLRRQMEPVLF